jgi:glutathione synthase/RimK-type ligase-like ATP-grasp enzyme
MIVRGRAELERHFEDLGKGDIVLGPLPARYLRGALAADLLERGVRCIPAVTCQALARSKCAQALVFRRWMAPHTRAVSRRPELMQALGDYARSAIGAVVTKQEGMHCGHGIRRWESIEALYNSVALDDRVYPFVLQPFLPAITDVRVIVVGEYVEAYLRENLYNFRANIAAGGASRPLSMDPAAEAICRTVMERGRFPYAHIDLHLTSEGACLLSEIALEGGIAAARIGRSELDQRKRERLEELARSMAPSVPSDERRR